MDGISNILILVSAGLVAGLIDSIAGGGGLITVPLLTILIGPGSLAIGTNKVAAVCSSLFALLVYMRAGHVDLKGNRIFALFVGLGAIFGALLSPFIPAPAYRILLILICPVILLIVFKKELWVRHEIENEISPTLSSRYKLILFWSLGLASGLYDGVAGPGGGTLMFLALFLVARIPLIAAMATAKVANLTSASLSLATYASTGNTGPIARGALFCLALILLVRLLFN
jgi:uncharacterized membrane protein YfcA